MRRGLRLWVRIAEVPGNIGKPVSEEGARESLIQVASRVNKERGCGSG